MIFFKHRIRMITQLLLLLVSIINYSNAQVGNTCTIQYTGISGICRLSTNCPSAKIQASRGVKPTICGYDSNSFPILCCEGNLEVNENSFLNSEIPNNSDGLIYPEDNENDTVVEGIAEKKCKEYSSMVFQEVHFLTLNVGATPSTINVKKCDYDGVPLIVGGKPALLGEFPFMAAIGYINVDNELSWLCGGTLISERFVMTAAHCAKTLPGGVGPPVKVRLGELDLASTNDGADPRDYDIERIIKPPNYKANLKYHDIALLKVKRRIEFNKHIRPACLWSSSTLKQNKAIATGWGTTKAVGETSDKLLKVTLNILPQKKCEEKYTANKQMPNGVTDSMICAGELEGGKDTCQGDSGGPLFFTKDKNQCIFYVVGITSFGKSCALPDTPGIYTRISSYLPWIEKTIW